VKGDIHLERKRKLEEPSHLGEITMLMENKGVYSVTGTKEAIKEYFNML
jgi:hypothetical protein